MCQDSALLRRCVCFFLCCLILVSGNLYSTPIDHKRSNGEQQFKLGVKLLIENQLEQAESALLASLKLNPTNGKYHWETGWLYWKKQNWEKVIYHWHLTQKYTPKQIHLDRYLKLAIQYHDWNQQETDQNHIIQQPSRWEKSEKNKLTLIAVGDLMMGSDYQNISQLPSLGGTKLFDATSKFLKGDIVFANLEGPLTAREKSEKCRDRKKCFVFRTPPEYGINLANAGFTVLNLANNHGLDFGLDGLKDTTNALKENNLEYFGSPGRSAIVLKINEINVGLFGVAAHFCCPHINQIKTNQQTIEKLRRKTDLVIVSFHGGGEGLDAAHVTNKNEIYLGESRGNVKKFAHAMIDAGADLVIGHGPHTLRGMEIYKNRPIVYSVGNFLGYKAFNTSGHLKYSMILKVNFSKPNKIENIKVIPLLLDSKVVPQFDSTGRSIMILNELSQTDFGINALLLDKDGERKL